jgi:hypothetical protein
MSKTVRKNECRSIVAGGYVKKDTYVLMMVLNRRVNLLIQETTDKHTGGTGWSHTLRKISFAVQWLRWFVHGPITDMYINIWSHNYRYYPSGEMLKGCRDSDSLASQWRLVPSAWTQSVLLRRLMSCRILRKLSDNLLHKTILRRTLSPNNIGSLLGRQEFRCHWEIDEHCGRI